MSGRNDRATHLDGPAILRLERRRQDLELDVSTLGVAVLHPRAHAHKLQRRENVVSLAAYPQSRLHVVEPARTCGVNAVIESAYLCPHSS
eukprot:1147320-Rhodomonas_salina.2